MSAIPDLFDKTELPVVSESEISAISGSEMEVCNSTKKSAKEISIKKVWYNLFDLTHFSVE
jgi:hypothetical protein